MIVQYNWVLWGVGFERGFIWRYYCTNQLIYKNLVSCINIRYYDDLYLPLPTWAFRIRRILRHSSSVTFEDFTSHDGTLVFPHCIPPDIRFEHRFPTVFSDHSLWIFNPSSRLQAGVWRISTFTCLIFLYFLLGEWLAYLVFVIWRDLCFVRFVFFFLSWCLYRRVATK